MSKRIFAQEQIHELLKNPNVLRCSEKSITYHKDFKAVAVRGYQEGLPPSVIFAQAGFNLAIIGKDAAKWCLRRWRTTVKQKGEDGFAKETRGGPGRRENVGIRGMSDHEKLKYYQAQVAYLKAENAFLAKLRKRS